MQPGKAVFWCQEEPGGPLEYQGWLFLQIMHAVTFMCLQE